MVGIFTIFIYANMIKKIILALIFLLSFTSISTASSPIIAGCQIFPSDNPWNQDISTLPIDPNSSIYLNFAETWRELHPDFGTTYNGEPWGISYDIVADTTPKFNITNFTYNRESDHVLYPIPNNVTIEGGANSTGDRHALILNKDTCMLYEFFVLRNDSSTGNWTANAGAVFNLSSNQLRPDGWTSADAAGLPIFPGLLKYDEVASGEIKHAIRFTLPRTRTSYIYPARHYAADSGDPRRPPMGTRLRLKADYNISNFSQQNQVILKALKKYGMILADNGGEFYISGAPDPRWNDADINLLKNVKAGNFEVIQTQWNCAITPQIKMPEVCGDGYDQDCNGADLSCASSINNQDPPLPLNNSNNNNLNNSQNNSLPPNNTNNTLPQNNQNNSANNTQINNTNQTLICTPNWLCESWSVCSNSEQSRTCTDSNSCNSSQNQPSTLRTCLNSKSSTGTFRIISPENFQQTTQTITSEPIQTENKNEITKNPSSPNLQKKTSSSSSTFIWPIAILSLLIFFMLIWVAMIIFKFPSNKIRKM